VIPQAPHGFEAFLPASRLAEELFRASYAFLNAQFGRADEVELPRPPATEVDSEVLRNDPERGCPVRRG
jgi:hypothetical protein